MLTKSTCDSIVRVLLAVCLLMLCACQEPEKNAAAELPPPAVRYIVLDSKDVKLVRELPGRVSAFTVSEVRPQVSGIIKERLFEEGSNVSAGQILYSISPELYLAAYNNAGAQLKQMEANAVSARLLADRYKKLVGTNAVSKQEYDDAVASHLQTMAAVDAAKQALETARINLGYTNVTSPISGRISRSTVTPGALVTQNQPAALTTVQQLSPVYVDMTVPVTDMLKMRRAATKTQNASVDGSSQSTNVVLILDDGSPYTPLETPMNEDEPNWIKGELLFSDVVVDQSTSTVNLRAKFDNQEEVLLPGMYVRAIVASPAADNAVLVPQKAVSRDAKGAALAYVLTKDASASGPDNKRELKQNEYYIQKRTVTIDSSYKNQWTITGGLKPGELLLVDGVQKVRPGQIVTGSPANSGDAAPVQTPAQAGAR